MLCHCQTLGYLVVLAGCGMAWVMHSGGGHVVEAHEAAGAPAGAPPDGRRRLLHEGHEAAARSRVAEMHGAAAYAILGLITLQVPPPHPHWPPLE